MKLETKEIIVNSRLRQVNPDTVSMLVASINDNGLLEPIKVRQLNDTYVLVDGNHRLQAYKQLGLEEIKIEIISFKGTQEEIERNCRLVELDANLATESLTEPQRHAHIYERLNIMVTKNLSGISPLSNTYEQQRRQFTKEAKAELIKNKWAKDEAYINSAIGACKALEEHQIATNAQQLDSRVYRKVVSACKKAARIAKKQQISPEEKRELSQLQTNLAQHDKLAEIFNARVAPATTPKPSKLEEVRSLIASLNEQERALILTELTVNSRTQ